MVIDKQAMFSVKFARNMMRYPAKEQERVLAQMPTKGVALIRSAQRILVASANKRGSN